MKKYKFLLLSLLVLIAIACSDDANKSDGDKPVIPEPTIPPVTVKNVTWADIAFPAGLSTIADPNTGISDPVTTTPTVVDTVIYDNNSDKHKVTIIIKDSIDAGVGDDGWGSAVVTGPVPFLSTLTGDSLWDNASFTRHNAIPETAILAIGTSLAVMGFGVNNNNSATWVLKDNGAIKSGYFVSINHLGINSKAYKALPADNKYTYKLDISTEDPFAKGESTEETLTYAEAIAKLPNTIKPEKPDFITDVQMVTLVTFTNPKKGYEIRVSDINDYAGFRAYLKERWNTGGQYFGKSHPKGNPMNNDETSLDELFGAFSMAVPVLDVNIPAEKAKIDLIAAAWAFVDGDNFVSFIFHGSKSPSNPLPTSKKNLFIIEVMSDDPMWFMPLKDDNAK